MKSLILNFVKPEKLNAVSRAPQGDSTANAVSEVPEQQLAAAHQIIPDYGTGPVIIYNFCHTLFGMHLIADPGFFCFRQM